MTVVCYAYEKENIGGNQINKINKIVKIINHFHNSPNY